MKVVKIAGKSNQSDLDSLKILPPIIIVYLYTIIIEAKKTF